MNLMVSPLVKVMRLTPPWGLASMTLTTGIAGAAGVVVVGCCVVAASVAVVSAGAGATVVVFAVVLALSSSPEPLAMMNPTTSTTTAAATIPMRAREDMRHNLCNGAADRRSPSRKRQRGGPDGPPLSETASPQTLVRVS